MKKNRTVLHLCIAAILFFLIKLLFPVVNGITPIGVSVIALFFSIVYLWTFEGVGWVSLLAIALFPCTGVMSYSEIAANSFGSWVTVFTLASCILNHALSESGMTDRIVKWAITRPAVQHHPWRFLCALFLSVYLVCLILDCTPAALVFFPMTLAICEQIGCEKQEKLSKVIFAGVMLSILLGYCATPHFPLYSDPVYRPDQRGFWDWHELCGLVQNWYSFLSCNVPASAAVFPGGYPPGRSEARKF